MTTKTDVPTMDEVVALLRECNPPLAEEVESVLAQQRLQADLAEAVALLRKLEWAGAVIDRDGCREPACPECGNETYVGHNDKCALSTFLGRVP